MIILDDPDDPDKFDDARSVVRPSTPTPSLPSYESSQALHPEPLLEDHRQPEPQSSRGCWPIIQNKSRFRRAVVYALVVYFVLTVAVGVPVIILKLRHRYLERQALYPAPPTVSITPSLIADGNEGPLLESSAVGCNAWTDQSISSSTLQYVVPLSGLVFLHSNVSYQTDETTVDDISGTLAVGVNSDPSVSDALVSVSMRYSDQSLKDRTSVCLMNISNSNGVYLYVPSNLTKNDTLVFNVTFLFPQMPSLHISEFVTMLPHFTQWYTDLSPYVTFDKVTIGGPRSEIIVGSMNAAVVAVNTALAEIQGNFNVSESLILETVSAPINVNISLFNAGLKRQPTFLDVSTGNAALNASVQLYLPNTAPQATKMPNFLARFVTFNAPMALAVNHMSDSAASAVQLRAENSVGAAMVSLDHKFSGTFDVSTTFADADVFRSSVDTVGGLAQLDLDIFGPASPSTSSAAAERTIEFDYIQTSRVTGWVGTGARPQSSNRRFNGQGHVDVVSTLSPVALLLGS